MAFALKDDTDAPIFYGHQDISADDINAVLDCLHSDRLTQGPCVANFEAALCEFTGAKHAVAVSNGTGALHIGALACGVGSADIGITAAVSFVASANCIEYCGGQAKFADIDPATGLISLDSLDALLGQLAREGRKPRLLVPVDMTGQSADLPAIRAMADKVDAYVLSDAAHSLGGSYTVEGETRRSGSCVDSDAAIFSFHPVKPITTGEGGAVLTNNTELFDNLRFLRSHGVHQDSARMTVASDDPFIGPWYYEQDQLGFNYRITDIQCSLGVSQLKRLPSFVERRQALAQDYDAVLSNEPLARHLRPLGVRKDASSAYHLYVVQLISRVGESLESVADRRKKLYRFLQERGIITQIHYIPIPWQPYYAQKYGFVREDFPGAMDYYARSLTLPLFPTLDAAQFDRICNALMDWAAMQ